MHAVMLATDGSASARAAETFAIELARDSGWPLRILTVATLPTATLAYEKLSRLVELEEAGRARAAEVVDRVSNIAAREGVEAETVIRSGDSTEGICSEARACDARLIVVGSHGWSPAHRLVVTSVSAGVLRDAPCPVLVVRHTAARPADAGGPGERGVVQAGHDRSGR